MFAKTAEAITRKLQESNSISNEQYEICRFGLQQGLTIVLNAVTVIVIGAIMGELWQALLFMILYAPLRSNAGGYHARTAERCYVYSVFLMVAILLAMKFLDISGSISTIIVVISSVVIFILAPVEDLNKPLDEKEQAVYKKRTYMVAALECSIFIIALCINTEGLSICVMWVFSIMAAILLIGNIKNKLMKTSDTVQKSTMQ